MHPRLLFIALTLLATAGYAPAQDAPLVETVVFRVDFLSLQPEVHYGITQPYQGTLTPSGYRRAAGLYYRVEAPADFGYTEIFSTLSGQRLVRATTWWSGVGEFEAPADSAGSTNFGETGPPVVADTVVAVLSGWDENSTVENARAAWDAVATTEPARALAQHGPVEVVVFEHFYQVGLANPATAEWLVVAYARPTVRDFAVVDIAWPGPLVTAGFPFEPEVTLHNFSGAADSGRLVLETDAASVYEETLPLAPGEFTTRTLPPLSLDGPVTLTVRLDPVGLPADLDPDDNALTQAVETTPLPIFRRRLSSELGEGFSLSGTPLDYDGDGDADLLREWQGDGQPIFAALWEQQDDGSFVDVTMAAGLDLPPFPGDAFAEDFTGDGVPDLLIGYASRQRAPVLLRGTGGGTFEDISAEAGLAGVAGYEGLEPADLDGDGDLDLVVPSEGAEPVFRNDGSGRFDQVALLDDPATTLDVAAADLDGDGDLDLVLANEQALATVFRNDGASGFTSVPGPWPGGRNRSVLPFDYDEDGDLDLLFSRTTTDRSVLLRNDGALAFAPVADSAFDIPTYSADAADFDADGRLDVVLQGFDGIVLLHRTADGFEERTAVLIGASDFGPGLGALEPRFLDFDADGDTDLFFRSLYYENQGAPEPGTATGPDPEPARTRFVVFPNPASHTATAALHLARESRITLRLFDVLGREVATLSDARRPAGEMEVVLPLASLPSGVYFVRLDAGAHTETRPITVLR